MEAMDKEEEIISRLKNLPGGSNKAKKICYHKRISYWSRRFHYTRSCYYTRIWTSGSSRCWKCHKTYKRRSENSCKWYWRICWNIGV